MLCSFICYRADLLTASSPLTSARWRESNISLMVVDLLDEDMLFEASIRRAVASTNTAPAKVKMHTAE